MTDDALSDLDPDIRQILEESRFELGPHPSDAELSAYARGELADTDAEALQDHLGLCSQCTSQVLASESEAQTSAADDGLSPAEVAARVDEIVALSQPSRRPVQVRSHAGGAPGWGAPGWGAPGWGAPGWIPKALAATLAIACLSLALVAAKLRQEVAHLDVAQQPPTSPSIARAELDQPSTWMPIVDLYPSRVVRGEAGEPPVALPEDATLLTLLLNPPSAPSHGEYELRILGAEGAELWRGGARPNEAGSFVLVLPRQFIAEQPSRIDLYATTDDEQRLIEGYTMRWSSK